MEKTKYNLTEEQIDDMKHALGFRKDRIKGRKHLRYEAYRNYYATGEGCEGFDGLVDMANKGLMLSRQNGTDGWYFHVSPQGIKYLSELTGVEITELDDSH